MGYTRESVGPVRHGSRVANLRCTVPEGTKVSFLSGTVKGCLVETDHAIIAAALRDIGTAFVYYGSCPFANLGRFSKTPSDCNEIMQVTCAVGD